MLKNPGEIQSKIDATLKPQSIVLGDTEATIHVVNALRKRQLSYNVIGLMEGSDPALSAETIIISAHYDHDGLAAGGGIYHGADDNGSGTVGVVALAKAFMKNPAKPKRSILFAVYAAEERGLLGAYYYAAHPLRPLATTRAVINFDMIGRDEAPSPQTDGLIEIPKDTANRLNLIGALYSPDYDQTVKQQNKAIGLTLLLTAMSAVHNIPAVYLNVGRNFGLRPAEFVSRVLYPAVAPRLILASRITLGVAWLVVVAAEMIAVNSGLGFLIIDARNAGNRYDLVVAGMIIIGLIGLLLDLAMRSLERLKFVRWGYSEE